MAGTSLTSPGRFLNLAMQTDGNLVLYNGYNAPLWRSKTAGLGPVWDAVMQTDGNFVIDNVRSHPLWASNTSGHPGSILYSQDDGNTVNYNRSGKAIWATKYKRENRCLAELIGPRTELTLGTDELNS